MSEEERRPVRLLVVDDEQNIADLISWWFTLEGWDVATAGSGPAAVALSARFDPDAVVLDLMLPGFDGIETLKRLRRLRREVVVVLSTADDSPESRAAALAAGAHDYLVKPYSLDALEDRLVTLLDHNSASSAASAAP